VRRKPDHSRDADSAVAQLRAVTDDMFSAGNIGNVDVATAVLVETLLARGGKDDSAEAEAATDRLAALPTHSGSARNHGAAFAGACGTSPRRRVHLSRLSGLLPRDGHRAWLRGAHEMGQGNAMTAVILYPY
jgi:hypothetical protein